VVKSLEKLPLRRPRRRWEDNINIDWTELAWNCDLWRNLVLTLLNRQVLLPQSVCQSVGELVFSLESTILTKYACKIICILFFVYLCHISPRPDRLWGPASLLMQRVPEAHTPVVKRPRRVVLTTHLDLVRRLRMCGAIPPFTHTSSCRGT